MSRPLASNLAQHAIHHLGLLGVSAPRAQRDNLTDDEVRVIVNRVKEIDTLVNAEHYKQDVIQRSPNFWGLRVNGDKAPMRERCIKRLKDITETVGKLRQEQSVLFKLITIKQAQDYNYSCEGIAEDQFKSER